MKRIACYVRVSTEEQKKHGLSVDSQIQALTEYCAEKKYNVVGIYNDAGISARKSYKKRPALLQLLQDCKDGKIDLIIFTKLDRWFRSVADYYEVQTQLDACAVPWRSIWEDYETETSSGMFKVNIMLSVAQNEADRTRERVRSAFQYKKERGDYVGSAPVGYIKKDNKLIKDENLEEAMNVFFKEYLLCFDSRRAVCIAKDFGFSYNVSVIQQVLRNPVYTGTSRNGYKVEPYITQEQFDLIQQTLDRNYRKPKKQIERRNYIFSGLVFCANCGKRMSASTSVEERKNKPLWVSKKYNCIEYKVLHRETNIIKESVIEQFLIEQIDSLIDNEISNAQLSGKPITDNKAKIAKLEQKLKRLANLYADGDIELDEYRAKRDAIRHEINELDIVPSSIPSRLPSDWLDIYNQLDEIHKRAFWMKFIDRIFVWRGEISIKFR